MNTNKSVLIMANIIKISMPFVAVAAMILYEYVTIGAKIVLNTENITRMVVIAVCMLFVYLPLKDIFINALDKSNRTVGKKKDYGTEVTYVYSNNIESFKNYCIYEYQKRREEVLTAILRNTTITVDEFTKKYSFDKSAIKKDKKITRKEKFAFLEVVREENRIKAESIDTVLPGGKHQGRNRKRVKSNSRRMNAFMTAKKSLTCIISATALISITFGFQNDISPITIASRALLVVGLVLMYTFSAFLSAAAINNEYCNELSEKTTFIIEFKEYNKKSSQNEN